jgi:hypothetical protein
MKGKWSVGVREYWVLNAALHYSITPVFHSLLGWTEVRQ